MQFVEMGNPSGKTLMLLPGTACDYQTNFAAVLDRLGAKYHLICVNYDGFDGSAAIFPDMITVTEKIEKYRIEKHGGRLDGAIGSSLGSSFVGQLIQRQNKPKEGDMNPRNRERFFIAFHQKIPLRHDEGKRMAHGDFYACRSAEMKAADIIGIGEPGKEPRC